MAAGPTWMYMAPSDAELQSTLGTSQSPPMLKASPSRSTTVIEEEGLSSVISSCNATGYRANGTYLKEYVSKSHLTYLK